jgi:hypothetical protein
MNQPRIPRQPAKQSDRRTKGERAFRSSQGPAELALTSKPLQGSEELGLADEPAQDPVRRHDRTGFDPYSSDGGFGRAHAWERVERD